MAWLSAYLAAVVDLLRDLWLYMVVGFVVAGVVEEFVSEARLLRYFGSNSPLSLLRGAATGFVVSACSCGAIPLVATLRRRGASTATSLTFLLASPWLGLPMLMIYVSFLGWRRTGLLVALSLAVAFATGLVLAHLERRGSIAQGLHYAPSGRGAAVVENGREDCADESCAEPRPANPSILWERALVRVPKRAFELGRDIGVYLLVGVLLAALAKAFVAPETVASYMGVGAGPWALLVALPVSIVIEACSEGFAVVAGQLYEMGATLAVVFVVTMVGVATDFTELSVVWRKFGRRTTLVYLLLGTSLTLLVGLALQRFV